VPATPSVAIAVCTPTVIQPFLADKEPKMPATAATPNVAASQTPAAPVAAGPAKRTRRHTTPDQVAAVRERYAEGSKLCDIAADLGMNPCTVRNIAYGLTHTVAPKPVQLPAPAVVAAPEPLVVEAVPAVESEAVQVVAEAAPAAPAAVDEIAAMADEKLGDLVWLISKVRSDRLDDRAIARIAALAGTSDSTLRAIARIAAVAA
jgi:transposase-like protein